MKESIRQSLKLTKDNNLEHSFDICNNGMVTKILNGKKTSVPSGQCLDSDIIGSFHTHPKLASNKDIVPSPADIEKAIEERKTSGLKFFCIGGSDIDNDKEIVRCFDISDLEEETKKITPKRIVQKMIKNKDYLDEHSHPYSY